MTTPDQPAGYKGIVSRLDWVTREQAALAGGLPADTRVAHVRSGREGTVRLDHPANVPGLFDGRPTAWCVADETSLEGLVCVSWETAFGVPQICWVRYADVRATRRPLANRPVATGR
jgi:hypothetical protein